MISVEPFNIEKHYETVSAWWKAQNWPVMPLSHLPATGIIATDDGKPASACWIYKTDSAYCLLEWIVADPELKGEPRDSALSVLIGAAKMLAASMGFITIHMSIRNQSLGKRLQAHGFSVADRAMTNYACNLSGRTQW